MSTSHTDDRLRNELLLLGKTRLDASLLNSLRKIMENNTLFEQLYKNLQELSKNEGMIQFVITIYPNFESIINRNKENLKLLYNKTIIRRVIECFIDRESPFFAMSALEFRAVFQNSEILAKLIDTKSSFSTIFEEARESLRNVYSEQFIRINNLNRYRGSAIRNALLIHDGDEERALTLLESPYFQNN